MVTSLKSRVLAIAIASMSILGSIQKTSAAENECSCAQPTESASSLVTIERIAKFSPRARSDLAAAIVRLWKDPPPGELVTPARVQHFMAQIATETGGLVTIKENLNYSARRLLEVFPTRVTQAQAQRLQHRPELIANHVYGGRLGNVQQGDGWRYRGSGFLQLTGRANFRARGEMLGRPLEEHPDLVRQPETGFDAAIAYWKAKAINTPAEIDDIIRVRKLINGGTNGLRESKIWLARAKRIFLPPAEAAESPLEENPDRAEEISAVQSSLSSYGYITETGPAEARSEAELQEALRNFQIENELPATGLYDEDTLYAIGARPPEPPLTDDEISRVRARLQQLRLLGSAEASDPIEIERAVKEFQLREGLEVNGVYDEPTLQLLLP